MDNMIVVSTPPHVKTKRTTKHIMLDVLIALAPSAIAGVVFFGWQALLIELMSVFACVATEFVYYFIENKGFSEKCKNAKDVCKKWLHQFDFTSIITGLILALILPVTDKWWQVLYEVLIGGVFAIAVTKMLFGGTGKNIVNPAAAGRVFMFLSFAISTYTAANFGAVLDSETITSGATVLSGYILQGNACPLSTLDLFLGTGVAGCIGETCKAAILLGYIYLSIRQVIKWWQPLLFMGVFGLVAVLMSGFSMDTYAFDITLFLPHILSGGVLFGAVFMFTDYTTSPKNVWGQIVYYVVGAIILAVLRFAYKIEVASFVIMIMNLLVPLIDKFIIPKPFGYKKETVQKEAK